MSLEAGRYQLFSALSNVQQVWRDVERKWTDGVRRKFEETVWTPMEQQTKAALAAIDQLDQIISQVKRDCGDE